MWFRWKRKRTGAQRKSQRVDTHYRTHKEFARSVIHERLRYWNSHYAFTYRRVSVKNQKRCWGSCSEKGNLNFNYKIVFLPQPLMDYVIVHELCHLAELNHSRTFWQHVEKTIPDYRERKKLLNKMTHIPQRGFSSSVYAEELCTPRNTRVKDTVQ